MKKLLIVLSLASLSTLVARAEKLSLPTDAEVGNCFTQVTQPATYKTVQVKELVQAASSRMVEIPAKYKTVYKSVKVKDGAERVETVPAKYKDVMVRVKVADAQKKVETIPAVYEQVEEKVLIKAARKVWKEGTGPHQKTTADGKILCLVEEPAVYQMVTKNRLVRPATTKTTMIPALYETQVKKVLVQAASTKVVKTPDIYKTVAIKEMVRPASTRRLLTPAKYATVSKTVVDSPESKNWDEVICETNASPEEMLAVQKALVAKGITVEATGSFDDQTQSAIEQYQRQNGLAVGYLNAETLQSLGLGHIL